MLPSPDASTVTSHGNSKPTMALWFKARWASVGAEFNPQFLFEHVVGVDPGEDPKSLGFQGGGDALDRVVLGGGKADLEGHWERRHGPKPNATTVKAR